MQIKALKKRFLSLLFFVSLAVVVSLTFIEPTGATESANNFMKDLLSILPLEVKKETSQPDKTGIAAREKIYSKLLQSSPHVQLPLSSRLKLFYNLHPVNKNSYESRNYDKNCSIFGIDISF